MVTLLSRNTFTIELTKNTTAVYRIRNSNIGVISITWLPVRIFILQ